MVTFSRTISRCGASSNSFGHRDEAYYIRHQKVQRRRPELAALDQREGFKGVARIGGVGRAESDSDEEAPARVGQDALAGPD